jgi:hypothetical protein
MDKRESQLNKLTCFDNQVEGFFFKKKGDFRICKKTKKKVLTAKIGRFL